MSYKNDFIKTLGVLVLATGCSPVNSNLISKTEITPKPEFVKKGEYTIVKNVSSGQVSSLEELLKPTKKKAWPEERENWPEEVEIEISESIFPEVLYYVSKGDEKLVLNSMGSSFIVHGDGYFLTAHHVFERYLRDLEAGNFSSFMLLYDPLYGFAATAKPLIFSVKDDILLGKVEITKYPIQTTHISESDEPPFDVVYSVTYNNTEYLSTDLFKEVMRSGAVDNDLVFHQNHTLPLAISKAGGNILAGHVVEIISKEKSLGMHSFISKAIGGNSGSPVFDFNYAQTGVITKAGETYDPTIPDVVIYTEASSIKEMIAAYIDFATSSKKF